MSKSFSLGPDSKVVSCESGVPGGLLALAGISYSLPIKNSEIDGLNELNSQVASVGSFSLLPLNINLPARRTGKNCSPARLFGWPRHPVFIAFTFNLIYGITGSRRSGVWWSGEYLSRPAKKPDFCGRCAAASRIPLVCADFLAWQTKFVELASSGGDAPGFMA